jgi:hypothetical protein
MSGAIQGMPSRVTAFQDKDGLIAAQWYAFIHNLWLRTGGANAPNTIASLTASVNTLNGEVTTLPGQTTTLITQVATINGQIVTINTTTDTLGSYVAQETVPPTPESDPALLAWLVGDA